MNTTFSDCLRRINVGTYVFALVYRTKVKILLNVLDMF